MDSLIKLYDNCWTNIPNKYYKHVRVHVDPIIGSFMCIITSEISREDVFVMPEIYGRVISMNQMHDHIVFFTTKNYMFIIVNCGKSFIELVPHQNGIPRLYGYIVAGYIYTFWFMYDCDKMTAYKYIVDMRGSRWTTIPMTLFEIHNTKLGPVYDIINVTHENQKKYKERMFSYVTSRMSLLMTSTYLVDVCVYAFNDICIINQI